MKCINMTCVYNKSKVGECTCKKVLETKQCPERKVVKLVKSDRR